VDFPASAHFSPLIGGTHNSSVTFWAEGSTASDGIKAMAEQGRVSILSDEFKVAIAAGTARQIVAGGGLATSPGTLTIEFDISQSHPLLTLVTMVAPSPDWFVGVSGLALFEGGRWVDERRVDLIAWDAGTDSGSTFTSPDSATTPRVAISRIVTAPLSPGGHIVPLGTFAITRIAP
jgi:hypothetical protein